jgi:hypothetical protein
MDMKASSRRSAIRCGYGWRSVDFLADLPRSTDLEPKLFEPALVECPAGLTACGQIEHLGRQASQVINPIIAEPKPTCNLLLVLSACEAFGPSSRRWRPSELQPVIALRETVMPRASLGWPFAGEGENH